MQNKDGPLNFYNKTNYVFFLLFTLQMSVLLLIASGQKSILENSVLGFEKKFNEPL